MKTIFLLIVIFIINIPVYTQYKYNTYKKSKTYPIIPIIMKTTGFILMSNYTIKQCFDPLAQPTVMNDRLRHTGMAIFVISIPFDIKYLTKKKNYGNKNGCINKNYRKRRNFKVKHKF